MAADNHLMAASERRRCRPSLRAEEALALSPHQNTTRERNESSFTSRTAAASTAMTRTGRNVVPALL